MPSRSGSGPLFGTLAPILIVIRVSRSFRVVGRALAARTGAGRAPTWLDSITTSLRASTDQSCVIRTPRARRAAASVDRAERSHVEFVLSTLVRLPNILPCPVAPVQIATLEEAIANLVEDGDTVALEGFTHLIPTAAGHEIIRQGRRDLTLVRLTPDIVYDQMIGMGCARTPRLLLGRQPRRREPPPVPRRGGKRLAGAARARGAQPRGDGQPLCGGRLRASLRRAPRLRRQRPRRSTRPRSGRSRAPSPARC